MFPYLPKQSGYNKRPRLLGTQITHLIRVLTLDAALWRHRYGSPTPRHGDDSQRLPDDVEEALDASDNGG